jgi:hypothetical protein
MGGIKSKNVQKTLASGLGLSRLQIQNHDCTTSQKCRTTHIQLCRLLKILYSLKLIQKIL